MIVSAGMDTPRGAAEFPYERIAEPARRFKPALICCTQVIGSPFEEAHGVIQANPAVKGHRGYTKIMLAVPPDGRDIDPGPLGQVLFVDLVTFLVHQYECRIPPFR